MTDEVEMTNSRFSKLLGNRNNKDCYRRDGFSHDDSEDSDLKHMEGGSLNDTNQSFQDGEDVKENEFTLYVTDAKSEL